MDNITIPAVSDFNPTDASNTYTLDDHPLQHQQDQMCEIHRLFELSIVCVEVTCDDSNSRVGCLKCLRQRHAGHKHILLSSLLAKQDQNDNKISEQWEEIAKLEKNVEAWVNKVRNAISKAKEGIGYNHLGTKEKKSDSDFMACQIAGIVQRNRGYLGSKTVDKQIKQCIQEGISLKDDKINIKDNQDVEDLREDLKANKIVKSKEDINPKYLDNQALENLKFEMHRLIDQLQMNL